MRSVLHVFMLFLLANSLNGQVLIDSLSMPLRAGQVAVPSQGEIYCLTFDNLDTLCHSTDGGEIWRIAEIPKIWENKFHQYKLSALPNGLILLTFTERNALKDTLFLALLRSLDGGLSWMTERFPVLERFPGEPSEIVISDTSTFYAAITNPNAVPVASYLRSTDTGKTWAEESALRGMQGLRFTTPQLGWAFSPSDSMSIVASTQNGGSTWQYDTLAWRIAGMEAQYDGSILVSPSNEGNPWSFKQEYDAEWENIVLPESNGFGALDFSWNRMIYFGGGRFIAFGRDASNEGLVFLTQDRGARWSRLQFMQASTESEWKLFDVYWDRAWRTDDARLFARQRFYAPLVSLQLPQPLPVITSAEDYSTTSRLQILLRWSNLSAGSAARTDVERSEADSNWTMLATGVIPEQEYLDGNFQEARTVRYRITLPSASGNETQVYSDTITPQLGVYVDLLDYILPREDKLLRYAYYMESGHNGNASTSTRGTLSLSFLEPWDSTSIIRVHPVRKILEVQGERPDTSQGRILEYMTRKHHFENLDLYDGFYYGVMDVNPSGPYFASGPRFPGYVGSEFFADMQFLPDSVSFRINQSVSGCDFLAENGVGIRRLNYRGKVGGASNHAYTDIDWQLIDHVNPADGPAQPVSAIAISSYPNPVTSSGHVRFELSQAEDVMLTVYDMLGRRVATLAEGPYSAGAHIASFNPEGIPPGTYLCRLRTTHEVKTALLLLLR